MRNGKSGGRPFPSCGGADINWIDVIEIGAKLTIYLLQNKQVF